MYPILMSFHKFLLLILSIKSAHFISTNCMQMLSVLKTERTRPDLTRFILVVVRRRKKKKFKGSKAEKPTFDTTMFGWYNFWISILVSTYIHTFEVVISQDFWSKHETLKKFLVKRQAHKKSKMKNTPTKMTSTHVPFHSAP